MKIVYRLIFLITILSILFLSCSVDKYTGLLTIKNQTDSGISSIKIGDTIITFYIGPGAKYDYYFYTTISGSLTAAEAESGYYDNSLEDEVLLDGTYTLKTNNWYSLLIRRENKKNYMKIEYFKHNADSAEDDLVDGDFYEE